MRWNYSQIVSVLPVNIKGLAGSVATLAGVLACNNDCKLAHDLEQCRDLHYLHGGQCFHCHFCVSGSLKAKEEF
ncbi:hypothetical protein POPTR_005G122550v4 [Populus trichocarpa]|uniref:Uncharacterized protein n=1 Tax=Populus trichocarpa TaxID=3694 RepID=A0A3N7EXM9_POPTR|nr:hypothetical protein POPTR_005G122550v4 [Populus trichocarpa]